MIIYLYKLSYPETDDTRIYIGQSIKPKMRLWSHINKAKNDPSFYSSRWIKSWLEKGIKPKMEILAEVDSAEAANFIEIFLIDLYRNLGFDLTNTAVGGMRLGRGEFHPNYGKKRDRKIVDKIAKANKELHGKERSIWLINNKYAKDREPPNKGKRKLTKEQVELIKQDIFNSHLNYTELSKKWNTNPATLSTIKHDKYFEVGWGYNSSANSWKNEINVPDNLTEDEYSVLKERSLVYGNY